MLAVRMAYCRRTRGRSAGARFVAAPVAERRTWRLRQASIGPIPISGPMPTWSHKRTALMISLPVSMAILPEPRCSQRRGVSEARSAVFGSFAAGGVGASSPGARPPSGTSMCQLHSRRPLVSARCQWHTSTGRREARRIALAAGWLSFECANVCRRGAPRHSSKARNCASLASFVRIAHLHFRLARQVGERNTAA